MFYDAIVLDNSNFFKKGTITVRIPEFYFGKMNFDLKEDFPDQLENNKVDGTSVTLDWEAKIASSSGGGRNYGSFTLPQVNEKGIVTFINGSKKKLLWVGSYFEPIKDDNYEVTAVNIPSDKLDSEGENSDGSINGEANLESENYLKTNFIYRTKNTTYLKDSSSEDDIDWEKVHTTNVVSIGEDRFLIRHYNIEGWNENTIEKYIDISLDKNEEGKDLIKLEATNVTDSLNSKITITDSNINILSANEDGSNSINVSTTEDYSINITTIDGNVIVINEDGISIHSSSDLFLKADGAINLESSDKVVLQDDEMGAVRIKELLNILSGFESHGHICPTGPTVGGPTDGSPAPLAPQLIGDKNAMESTKIGIS